MQLSRLVELTELNNAWLVGLGVLCALLAIWAVLVTSSFLLGQGIRASRVRALEAFAEGLHKRARLIAVILSLLVTVAGAAGLGYTLWQGIDLQPEVDALLAKLTRDTLLALARSVGLVLFLLLGFYVLQRAGRQLMGRLERWVERRELQADQRGHLEKLFVHLPSVVNLALAYAVVNLASVALALPEVVAWLLATTVYILLAISSGRALVALTYFLSERLLWSWEKKSKGTRLEEYYAALRRLLPVGQKSVEAIIYVSVATLVVRKFETLEPFSPYGPIIIRVISMILAASVVAEFSRVMIARLLLPTGPGADDALRRRHTFVSLIQKIVKYVIYFCVAMMALSDVGIDPTPILAGAGIVGLTVGLGSQKIVQDLLNGLFLLFEDQILNGDYVRIGDTEGTVEEISLRITRIRDRFGRLHIRRNGEIENVINYSRGWTMAVVDMSVAYESDLRKALEVIAEVSARLPAQMPDQVIDTPQVMGIEAIDESCLRIRIETKVAPGCHFEAKRVLHRLLVDGFRDNDLEIPYPKSVELGPED